MIKRCIVNTTGPIPELGYISGPITNPCKLELSVLQRMVKNGREIYEIDPSNSDNKVLLTLDNYNSDNFGTRQVNTVKVDVPQETVEDVIETPVEEVADESTEETVEDVIETPVEEVADETAVVNEPKVQQNNKSQKNKNKNHQKNYNKNEFVLSNKVTDNTTADTKQ